MHASLGEHNSIEFKREWIKDDALAKEILVLANSQRGIILFGIGENKDKSTCISGLNEIMDQADVSKGIKKFISSHLKYEICDFSYQDSEYKALQGKHFPMLIVHDTPEYIPFLSRHESTSIKPNMIYIRRGTSCELANQDKLDEIFNRRLNYSYPLTGKPLQLEQHLEQLKSLYKSIKRINISYRPSIFKELVQSLDENGEITGTIEESNEYYPEESYDEFISRMIIEKKRKIKRVLDLY